MDGLRGKIFPSEKVSRTSGVQIHLFSLRKSAEGWLFLYGHHEEHLKVVRVDTTKVNIDSKHTPTPKTK